jgi:hypothetical protein
LRYASCAAPVQVQKRGLHLTGSHHLGITVLLPGPDKDPRKNHADQPNDGGGGAAHQELQHTLGQLEMAELTAVHEQHGRYSSAVCHHEPERSLREWLNKLIKYLNGPDPLARFFQISLKRVFLLTYSGKSFP